MVKDSSLCARTEINPVRFGSGQLSPRVLHRYVAMAKPLVYEKSKKRVLTNVAYSTVVPTKEKTPVNSLNGNQYMVADTGETFASRKPDTKEAYEVFLHQKSVLICIFRK